MSYVQENYVVCALYNVPTAIFTPSFFLVHFYTCIGGKAPSGKAVEECLREMDYKYTVIEPSKLTRRWLTLI